MNALLLPGNSTRHAEWIEKMKEAVVIMNIEKMPSDSLVIELQ